MEMRARTQRGRITQGSWRDDELASSGAGEEESGRLRKPRNVCVLTDAR